MIPYSSSILSICSVFSSLVILIQPLINIIEPSELRL